MRKEGGDFFKLDKNETKKKDAEGMKNGCLVCGSEIIGGKCKKCKTRYNSRNLEAHVPGYAGKKDIYEKK